MSSSTTTTSTPDGIDFRGCLSAVVIIGIIVLLAIILVGTFVHAQKTNQFQGILGWLNWQQVSEQAQAPVVAAPAPAVAAPPAAPQQSVPPAALADPAVVAPSGSECLQTSAFAQMVSETRTVSQLLSELDRSFNLSQGHLGGQWTQEMAEDGFTVPANSVFWTDLFENVTSLPAGTSVVRTQGGWGIYASSVQFTVPLPNGGGRFASLCSETAQPAQTQEDPVVVATATSAPVVDGSSSGECLTQEVAQTLNSIEAYNAYFEEQGYAFGQSVERGARVPEGSLFLGTFPSGLPSGVRGIPGSNGFVWYVVQAVTAPEGGRSMGLCSAG